jgi:hypothetical protein
LIKAIIAGFSLMPGASALRTRNKASTWSSEPNTTALESRKTKNTSDAP